MHSTNLTLTLGETTTVVFSLAEAREKVRAFIREHDVAAAEYGSTTGRIYLDGVPYCRVSYFGKLWMLDERGRECFREMNEAGEVAP